MVKYTEISLSYQFHRITGYKKMTDETARTTNLNKESTEMDEDIYIFIEE
jgi:hypothetical protein